MNQALKQSLDSVLRYGEHVGRELLNYVVRRINKNLDLGRGSVPVGGHAEPLKKHQQEPYRAMILANSRGSWTSTGECANPGPSRVTITSTA